MELEAALKEVSKVGRFQVLIYIFYGLQGVCFAVWDVLSTTSFVAATPEYHCQYENVDALEELQIYESEYRSSGSKNATATELPEVYNCADGNVVFNPEPYGETIVTEWQLIGSQASTVELSQSVFMVGMMIGSVVLGQLSDSYGRKPVLLLSVVMSPLLGLAIAFAPNIWIFTLFRFLIGFVCPGSMLTCFILAMELFPVNIRASLGIAISVFNAVGYVMLSVMAYAIKDWRRLQITLSVSRIILLPLCYFVQESFQWLIVRGKTAQLEQVLRRVARYNNVKIPYPILGDDKSCDSPNNETSPDQLYTTKGDGEDERSEKGKSFDKLFLYDSALSLERDYIPAEDQYTEYSFNDESEAEDEFTSNVFNFGGLSAATSSLLALRGSTAAAPKRIGISEPAAECCEDGNLYRVNSSISILSDLQEQLPSCESYEELYDRPTVPAISVPIAIEATSFTQQPSRLLRKKSISLCHISNFVDYISEVQGASYRRAPDLPHQVESSPSSFNKDLLTRTSSTPHINGSTPSGVPRHEGELYPNLLEGKSRGLRARKRGQVPNLLTIPDHGNDSYYFLSIPMLALPVSFSQNVFPGMRSEHYAVVSQSTDTLQDNTSGFESSFSNIPQSSDYYQCDSALYEHAPMDQGEHKFVDDLKNKTEEKSYHAVDLFRTSSVRIYTICGMIMWFATYSIYVGLSMSTDGLAGDPYINFILSGLVEIPAVIIALFSTMRFGRRLPSIFLHIMALLSCCLYLVLPAPSDTVFVSVFSVGGILLAKTFTAAAYFLEGLLCLELLPIPLRTIGLGFMTLSSRLGGVIVPFILLTGEVWIKYPMMIFTGLSIISVLALIPVPETTGIPDPRTPDDVKNIRKLSKERRQSKADSPVSIV